MVSYCASHSSRVVLSRIARSEAPHTRPTVHEPRHVTPTAPSAMHVASAPRLRVPPARSGAAAVKLTRAGFCPTLCRARSSTRGLGCSAATIARASPTGTPAIDPMASIFAATLLLKMVPPPGCANHVTRPRATRSVACVTRSRTHHGGPTGSSDAQAGRWRLAARSPAFAPLAWLVCA